MPEMKTLTIGGETFEIVDEKARTDIEELAEKGIYVGSGDMPDGYSMQIDPDGEALTEHDLIPRIGTDNNWWIGDTNTGVSAVVEEDWQLLCDTTTTEEITSFGIDKDMDGNPFSCRKIVAKAIMPEVIPATAYHQTYFGHGTEMFQGYVYAGTNVKYGQTKVFQYQMELVKNKFVLFQVQQSMGHDTFCDWSPATWIQTKGVESLSSLTKFFIANNYTPLPFPIGTRIIVWGCKA